MHDEDTLDGAAVVICFVTDCYLKKVAGNGPAGEKDKCLFEYEHVVRTKGASKMIAVINDKQCSNTAKWFGPVAQLASTTYYDYSKDDLLEPVAGQIHTRILSILDKVTVTDRLTRAGVLQNSGSSGGSGSAATGVGVGAAAEATELEDAEAAVVKKEASDTAEAQRAILEAQDLDDLEAGKAGVESQKSNMHLLHRSDDDIHKAVRLWVSMKEEALARYGNISDWNTRSVTRMSYLFGSRNLKNIKKSQQEFNDDISMWDTSNVIDMTGMFEGASAFNCDISAWKVRQVKHMTSMFKDASLFKCNIGEWNVGNVTRMDYMFEGACSFPGTSIGSWDVSQVNTMRGMFNCTKVFNGDITAWKVGKVEDMHGMFYNAPMFNCDIGAWDVSEVATMSRMFHDASAFNQCISAWKVSNVDILNYYTLSNWVGIFENCPITNNNMPERFRSDALTTSTSALNTAKVYVTDAEDRAGVLSISREDVIENKNRIARRVIGLLSLFAIYAIYMVFGYDGIL
jgi:hypothetical protein